MQYDVDYFIKKFEAIPEERWTINKYIDEYGNKCALGHCGMRHNSNNYGGEVKAFSDIIKEINIVSINDGTEERYQQLTPKQRILAALYDVKKMQLPEDKPKQRIVYMAVDAEIKKQSEQLILS